MGPVRDVPAGGLSVAAGHSSEPSVGVRWGSDGDAADTIVKIGPTGTFIFITVYLA